MLFEPLFVVVIAPPLIVTFVFPVPIVAVPVISVAPPTVSFLLSPILKSIPLEENVSAWVGVCPLPPQPYCNAVEPTRIPLAVAPHVVKIVATFPSDDPAQAIIASPG